MFDARREHIRLMTTIFTVGSVGADFTTIQAAFNAVPEPLNDAYEIQLFNELFNFTGLAIPLQLTARTTTPTFNLKIKCAPGASFMDNVNKRTNALRWNSSNGAAIRCEDAPAFSFGGTINDLTIDGIQFLQDAPALSSFDILKCAVADLSTNKVIQNCIVQQQGSDNNDCMFLTGKSKIINCLVIHGGNNPDSGIKLADAAVGYETLVIDCTVVRPSNLAAQGIGLHNKLADPDNRYVAIGCASFGFLTDAFQLSPSFGGNTTNFNGTSFSDVASGFPDNTPDTNVYSVPYDTTTFQQPSNAGGNQDYRSLITSLLRHAGVFNSNAPRDITGFPRGAPPDIGAWDNGGGGGSGLYVLRNRLDQLAILDDEDEFYWNRMRGL